MNHDVEDSINPVYDSLCQSVFYLPEIRSSVSQYLVQSRYRQVTFSRTVMHDPVIKHFDHTELIMMMHYREGPVIPLRHTEWQIPVSIRVNPTDIFGDTRSIPL